MAQVGVPSGVVDEKLNFINEIPVNLENVEKVTRFSI